MDKRHFLNAAVAGAAATLASTRAAAQHAPASAKGPTLLTVSGLIGAGNRGAVDPALDQMMVKQKLGFTKAQTFDWAALVALPAVTIRPTLEYDGRRHELTGPLLIDVARASGVQPGDRTAFFVRAVDGYAALLSAAEAAQRRTIVATHLDGRPMALGGLGPLWVVFEPDRHPEIAAKPLAERFASCPWATYHIEVRET